MVSLICVLFLSAWLSILYYAPKVLTCLGKGIAEVSNCIIGEPVTGIANAADRLNTKAQALGKPKNGVIKIIKNPHSELYIIEGTGPNCTLGDQSNVLCTNEQEKTASSQR